MHVRRLAAAAFAALLLAGCSSSSGDSIQGNFFLIEFLESGKDSLPRNRELTFRFSGNVAPNQDFAERLKIQNVQTGANGDFSRALGLYFVNADSVTFLPRLPEAMDRSDAGFRSEGNYHVFLKAGADALTSTTGDRIASQQEFLFDTSDAFEDPLPSDPPRALQLVVRNIVTNGLQDMSRLDPNPNTLRQMDSNDLLSALDSNGAPAPRAIEPGAGGAPNYTTPWEFELYISEPLDPLTVTTDNVSMVEIRNDALDTATTANPGTVGTLVNFKVPIEVELVQQHDTLGNTTVFIRVRPIQTLVDDARYRLTFSGSILGLDFRKAFIGENGLSGDGLDVVEPGGIGYVTEFLVFDRPAITATRTVSFDPLVDGINPEVGNTTLDEALFNSAQYNPASDPGKAVGVIGSFGQGDVDFSVSGATIATLDTGDELNDAHGSPFTSDTADIDYTDTYKNTAGFPPAGFLLYQDYEPTVFQFGTFTISSSATLQVIGINPCRIVCTGLVTISGVLDASGGDGGQGFSTAGTPNQNQNTKTTPGFAGVAGPGGWAGGESSSPQTNQSQNTSFSCSSSQGFNTFLNATGVDKTKYPHTKKGEGPGRGNQGGEAYVLTQGVTTNDSTGTGGGGGSHATLGTRGADRFNGITASSTTSTGQPGKCGQWGVTNSSLIGVRGMPGPTYGDRLLFDVIAGGSGGGAGGGTHGWYNSGGGVASGGGGGGGGGFLEIIAAGQIVVAGGVVTVAGGDGGKGAFQSLQGGSWSRIAGSGGGGAGGGLSLISGNDVDLSGAVIDARGGIGGPRPNNPPSTPTCNSCNEGGDGGKGFILVMDPDGLIPSLGLLGFPGNYDGYEFGILSVRPFDVNRFGGISAVTELFNVRAANPRYLPMAEADIVGKVNNPKQEIIISISSAKGDVTEPALPDLASELKPAVEIARIVSAGAGVAVNITGDMSDMNQFGVPAREAFLRVIAVFDYQDPVEAALGPFSSMDEVTTTFTFND